MTNIETATPREIADYLNYLVDTAWKKTDHKTDEDSGFAHEIWRRLYNIIFSEEVSKKYIIDSKILIITILILHIIEI